MERSPADMVFSSADGRAVVLGEAFLATKSVEGAWSWGFPGTAEEMDSEFSSVRDPKVATMLSKEARTSVSVMPVRDKKASQAL